MRKDRETVDVVALFCRIAQSNTRMTKARIEQQAQRLRDMADDSVWLEDYRGVGFYLSADLADPDGLGLPVSGYVRDLLAMEAGVDAYSYAVSLSERFDRVIKEAAALVVGSRTFYKK